MQTQPSAILKTILPIATLTLLLVFCAPAFAATAAINNTSIAAKQLTINGNGFSGSPLAVTLDGQELAVVSTTPTQIIVSLDAMPSGGKHKLVVTAGETKAVSTVTVFTSAQLVAELNPTQDSVPIPPTTLFIPTENATYQVSASLKVVTPNQAEGSGPQFWRLDFGTGENAKQVNSNADHGGSMLAYANAEHLTGSVASWVVKGHVGVPITYSVSPSFPELSGTYEVSITVELMQ